MMKIKCLSNGTATFPFQGGFSRFQVGFMVSKVPGWFFIVPGRFLWFFKVPGSFFMVPSGFSWFFKVSGWFFEVSGGF